MFWYSVRKQVAAMIAALDEVDLIVFTGGIGENDGEARAAICDGLSWIGVSLDEARNRSVTNPDRAIPRRAAAVLVLASQEDEQIARHTWALFPTKSFLTLWVPRYSVSMPDPARTSVTYCQPTGSTNYSLRQSVAVGGEEVQAIGRQSLIRTPIFARLSRTKRLL